MRHFRYWLVNKVREHDGIDPGGVEEWPRKERRNPVLLGVIAMPQARLGSSFTSKFPIQDLDLGSLSKTQL